MRIKALSVACLAAGSMLALGDPATGSAQGTSNGKFTVAGEIGTRGFTQAPDSLAIGKFQEHRDLRAGQTASPALDQLLVKYTPKDSFNMFSLSGRKLFEKDQSVWLQAKRPGAADFELRWDRIPHTYSSTARSPGIGANYNSLPSPRPDSIAWRNAPYVGLVANQWDPVRASFGLTPSDNLDFKAEYTRIAKKGGIPLSLSYSGSSGPQREFIAPVDQTMNDFRLSQGYASGERAATGPLSFIRSYQGTVSYGYSKFSNDATSTMVDNPQLSVSSRTIGTASSRVSLAPNNTAHTGSFVGAIQFPLRTRVTGSWTSSWQRQNDPLVPQTSNDSLQFDPNYGLVSTLARPSLDGRVRTTTLNLSANTHPMARLTLAGKYRNFDYANNTAPFHNNAMVVSDRSIAVSDSATTESDPFTKTNSDVSASYLFPHAVSLTAGYGWEYWKRDAAVRQVGKTTEKTPRVSLDYNEIEWLSLRASYSEGARRFDGPYTQAATEILNFRRFDEADRDRKRLNLLASVIPIDQITIGLNYQIGNDTFPNSQYGTASDKSTMTGFDVDWAPVSRFTAGVGYSREDVNNVLNTRYRTGAVGSVTYDNPTYKWTDKNTDKNITTYGSLSAVLIPDKLDVEGTVSVIDAHFWVNNFNPNGPPTGGTAAQNLSATAEPWPEVTQKMTPVSMSARYRYSSDWSMTLRLQMENYRQNDFRTSAPVFTNNTLASGTVTTSFSGDLPGTVGQVAGSNTGQYHFLGNNYHPYDASWLTVMMTYNPSSLRPLFRAPRSTF